jgi:hypothetical protein
MCASLSPMSLLPPPHADIVEDNSGPRIKARVHFGFSRGLIRRHCSQRIDEDEMRRFTSAGKGNAILIVLCICKFTVGRRDPHLADTNNACWLRGAQPADIPLIGYTSRSAAPVWPGHPQRSCCWHSPQGQSRLSGSGLQGRRKSCFSSNFSPVVMSSGLLRTAGCLPAF